MYDELIKNLRDCTKVNSLSLYKRGLMKQAADAIEEVTDRNVGKWMHKEITADFHAVGQCSVCKERRRLDNFCSNCGADMRGREDD